VLVVLWYSVCGPLPLQGLRGKKSTPSVGWEVSVRSHRSKMRARMEHTWDNDSELSHWATVCMSLFLNGRLMLFLCFHYCTSIV
jgi:hypothetical protein